MTLPNSSFNILIAEDHPFSRKGIIAFLTLDFPNCQITEACDGKQALAILQQQHVDIVLLDIGLPHIDGLKLYQLIKVQWPAIRIIVLTCYEGYSLMAYFTSEKVTILHKSMVVAELKNAIDSALEGQTYFTADMLRVLSNEKTSTIKLPISPRDRELLKLISEGASSKEIACVTRLTENTVNSYRRDLLLQANTKNTDELVAYAYQNGLL